MSLIGSATELFAKTVQEEIRFINNIINQVVDHAAQRAGAAAGGILVGLQGKLFPPGAASGAGAAIGTAAKRFASGAGHAGGQGHASHNLSTGSSGPRVLMLQHVLNMKGAFPKLKEDGKFGSMTDAAVRRFQAAHGLMVDGIVGPKTWLALNGDGSVKKMLQKATSGGIAGLKPGGLRYFPFARVPSVSWLTGARFFGAYRDAGRLHAGCDLLAAQGTPIFAIADGVLLRGPYEFTGPSARRPQVPLTHAVEIRHGDILVRYGEISPGSYTGGHNPSAGTVIAKVGAYQMLHLEVYSNGASSNSLNGAGPYRRRGDVTNPAPYLAQWKSHLPGGH